jgi:hypothetical protein
MLTKDTVCQQIITTQWFFLVFFFNRNQICRNLSKTITPSGGFKDQNKKGPHENYSDVHDAYTAYILLYPYTFRFGTYLLGR